MKRKKLKYAKPGDLKQGQTVLALQSLNLPPVHGTVTKIDEPITDNYGHVWQGVLIEFAVGGAWFHLASHASTGVFLA
jgi:hypothetical protein